MVAVAWTVADVVTAVIGALASAIAAINTISDANAVSGEW